MSSQVAELSAQNRMEIIKNNPIRRHPGLVMLLSISAVKLFTAADIASTDGVIGYIHNHDIELLLIFMVVNFICIFITRNIKFLFFTCSIYLDIT